MSISLKQKPGKRSLIGSKDEVDQLKGILSEKYGSTQPDPKGKGTWIIPGGRVFVQGTSVWTEPGELITNWLPLLGVGIVEPKLLKYDHPQPLGAAGMLSDLGVSGRGEAENRLRSKCYIASDEVLTGNLFGSKIVTAVWLDLVGDWKTDEQKRIQEALNVGFSDDPQHAGGYAAKDKLKGGNAKGAEDVSDRIALLKGAAGEGLLKAVTVCFDRDCKSCPSNPSVDFDISGLRAFGAAVVPGVSGHAPLAALHAAAVSFLLGSLGNSSPPVEWIQNMFDAPRPNASSWLFSRRSRPPITFASAGYRLQDLPAPEAGSQGREIFLTELGGEDREDGGAACVGVHIAAYIAGLFELRHIARCKAAASRLNRAAFITVDEINHDAWTQNKQNANLASSTDPALLFAKEIPADQRHRFIKYFKKVEHTHHLLPSSPPSATDTYFTVYKDIAPFDGFTSGTLTEWNRICLTGAPDSNCYPVQALLV